MVLSLFRQCIFKPWILSLSALHESPWDMVVSRVVAAPGTSKALWVEFKMKVMSYWVSSIAHTVFGAGDCRYATPNWNYHCSFAAMSVVCSHSTSLTVAFCTIVAYFLVCGGLSMCTSQQVECTSCGSVGL